MTRGANPIIFMEADIEAFIKTFREEMVKTTEDLKSAAAMISAIPTVIYGHRGVIEAELQPAVLIIRRSDATSLRDMRQHEKAKRKELMASSTETRSTGTTKTLVNTLIGANVNEKTI
ncbi:hypothetical protein K469DRAFT_696353 [Zopfia rhizophila CBS 207.26]|uniref:Uncharacterized protein n=1 Tax=Zopfia rhizophila CBS 207.26 TaxID=1314779 RepID=A0A6A6DE84_9PEZI|nr:hypothetical protein K469DRAFT_696353 [Zopfia rhizophila CBS 207.26]